MKYKKVHYHMDVKEGGGGADPSCVGVDVKKIHFCNK